MKLFVTLIVAAAVTISSATLFHDDPSIQKQMWENFKKEFRRDYAANEDSTRFVYFLDFLKRTDERNQAELSKGGSAVHGITKFADLSQKEFEERLLTADVKKKGDKKSAVIKDAVRTDAGLVDWSGTLTTPVKNQGYCGSCWAFSATEQIESDTMRTLSTSYILSPEQITQCDGTSYGCNGGWTESAYSYVKSAGGIAQDSAYPYTSYYGTTGTCKSDSSDFVVTVSDYYTINGESSMASYVQSTGPLSVCLDASSWNSYTGGIMSNCGNSVDHCVQAVGVDTSSSTPYWKVRNSWGTDWGESGYIRLAYGQNTCDITNDPTYTTVSLV